MERYFFSIWSCRVLWRTVQDGAPLQVARQFRFRESIVSRGVDYLIVKFAFLSCWAEILILSRKFFVFLFFPLRLSKFPRNYHFSDSTSINGIKIILYKGRLIISIQNYSITPSFLHIIPTVLISIIVINKESQIPIIGWLCYIPSAF